DAARRLTAIAIAAAKRASSTITLTNAQNLDKEVADIAAEFQTSRPARDKLANDPDADVSYQWGRFLAYYKGQWGDGLPLLASGSDENLLQLARKDQANPKEMNERLDVADTWYTMGKAEKSMVARKNVWLRAKFWYEQTQAAVAGDSKTRV